MTDTFHSGRNCVWILDSISDKCIFLSDQEGLFVFIVMNLEGETVHIRPQIYKFYGKAFFSFLQIALLDEDVYHLTDSV